jgi:hypothetical protein
MAKLPDMTKHRGFPSGMPGTGLQFTIRRANPKGISPLVVLPRRFSRDDTEHRADAAFIHAIWHCFGAEPFERGNLDARRLSRLFEREVLPAEKPFDKASYQAMLQLNEPLARSNFPEAFEDVLEV